jgi:ABC-type multidrug transport system, ATPase component
MSDYVIEANSLTKYYGVERALENLDLKVKNGSIYALLGHNGSGKTTLVKLLTGQILKYTGSIRLFGKQETDITSPTLKKRLGYVSENRSMYDYMTPRYYLDFTSSFYENWDPAMVTRCLGAFEVPLDTKISKLSKGTRCQLALTAAMGIGPDLLILDEPADGLDPLKRNQFYNIILDLIGDSGKSVLLTTNNTGDAARIADHTGIIRDGRLYIDGETEELVNNYKKVRIAFKEDYEPDFQCLDGIFKIEHEKRSYLLHFNKSCEEIFERLKEMPYIFMDVINMSLEDIYMDVNGGRI